MNKIVCLVLLTAFSMGMNVLKAQEVTDSSEVFYVAVLPLESQGGLSASEAQILTARLRDELVNLGIYRMLDRGNMETILQEQNFQLSGCTSDECAVEVGRLLGVNRMIAGSIGRIGQTYSISARLINVETGEITKTITDDYRGEIDGLLLRMKAVAQRLSGLQPTVLPTGAASLQVTSTPSEGRIFLNGVETGYTTPHTFLDVEAGSLKVAIRKDTLFGETALSLEEGDSRQVDIPLSPEQFTFRIQSIPSGAEVSLDGEYMGTTPLEYRVTDSTKSYVIEVQKEEYGSKVDTVRFRGTKFLTLNFNLSPTIGSLAFPYTSGMDISINGVDIENYKTQVTGSFNGVRFGQRFRYQRVVIEDLPLDEYTVRIEQERHYPLIKTVRLTEQAPNVVIEPSFQLVTANLVLINSGTSLQGSVGNENFTKGFALKPTEQTQIPVPLGTYEIHAEAPGHFDFQTSINVMTADTHFVNIILNRPNKTRAILTSMLIPGGGQFYTRQPSKGIFYLLLTAGSASWAIKTHAKYSDGVDIYNQYVEDYAQAGSVEELNQAKENLDASKHDLDILRTRFIGSLAVTGFVYLLNLNDMAGYFDAPDDSPHFQVDVIPTGENQILALQCSFHF